MSNHVLQNIFWRAKLMISHFLASKTVSPYWAWIALLESLVIVLLLLVVFVRKDGGNSLKKRLKQESLSEDIDFGNLMNSSFHSIELYDKLKVKCHPDRYPTDKEKNAIAESLFQEITKNKTNHKRLLELKEEAKQKLNIKF